MKAGTTPGAEDGGNIAISILFDGDYCANSATPDSIDFAKMGQETCEQAFGQVNEGCSEDESWDGYDKDKSGFGGVAGALCGIWGIAGVPK